MALIVNEKIAHATTLGIWKKEEELSVLETVFPLKDEETEQYLKISNLERKKEWLTVRILFAELLQKRIEISYTEHNKPFIVNSNLNISISHSHDFVAVIISNNYFPGVDIEKISERVSRIKHKFLNTEELDWCTDIEKQTICWSAKESVFKIFEKELDFHDMVVSKFEIDADKGHFTIRVIKKGYEKSYPVYYRIIEDNILTYCVSKMPVS